MTRRLILCAVAAAALVPGAAAAEAATTVSYAVENQGGDEQGYAERRAIHVVAAGAERNDMTVTTRRDGFVVRDAATALQPGTGCTSVDAQTVRCAVNLVGGPRPKGLEQLTVGATVELGAGDDRLVYDSSLSVDDEETTLTGGAGDDTIAVVDGKVVMSGGEGVDTLRGGPDGDFIFGGPRSDVIDGAGGDDFLGGDDAGLAATPVTAVFPDTISGGPGSDTLSYANHQVAVTVDLADPAGDGAVGEQDVVHTVENVIGGAGDDALRGDGNANRLEGRDGNDSLAGRDGNDRLNGETIDAGAGRDLIEGLLGAVTCGAGTDRIAALSLKLARRAAPADCELVDVFAGTATAHPRLAGDRVTVTIKSARAYTGTLKILDGRTVLASRRIKVPAARKPLTVSLRIPAAAATRRRTLTAQLSNSRIAGSLGVARWWFAPRGG